MAVSAFNGVSSVPVVAEIAPQWADQLQGPQGLIWHFGAETDLLNLQCTADFPLTATSTPKEISKYVYLNNDQVIHTPLFKVVSGTLKSCNFTMHKDPNISSFFLFEELIGL